MRTVRGRRKGKMVYCRMTAEDLAELERMAANDRATVSAFVRTAIRSYVALRGSKRAWKVAGPLLVTVLQERFGARVNVLE